MKLTKSYNLLFTLMLSYSLIGSANAAIINGTKTTYEAGAMYSGLDLSGTVRASSFGNGIDYTVGSTLFSGTSAAGISFTGNTSSSQFIPNSGNADLNGVLSSGIHTASIMAIDISTVVGQTYDIQLLFFGSHAAFGDIRSFDVLVETVLFADEYRSDDGVYSIYDFSTVASDNLLNITFAAGVSGDTNPFVQGIVVTDVTAVPAPAAAWLFGSALLGLGALKRKKA